MDEKAVRPVEDDAPLSRAFFIGRFQPFHNGHLHMVKRILTDNGEIVIGIGSAQYSHTRDNPFTAGERYEMIKRTLDEEGILAYHIVPIPDTHVHSVWVSHVRSLAPSFDRVYTNSALVVRLFKEAGLKVVELPMLNRKVYRAAEIRRRMYEGGEWRALVPPPVAEYIDEMDGIQRIRETFGYRSSYPTQERDDP
jgi:nicotinamide-nucleotide adenylyltransferase